MIFETSHVKGVKIQEDPEGHALQGNVLDFKLEASETFWKNLADFHKMMAMHLCLVIYT